MSTQVRQCNLCNRIFHSYSGSRTCPECTQKADDDFVTVRDYIYDHPHATIKEISEKTDVKEADILKMLKEGRLILETATGILLCERCSKPIHSGKLCDDCKTALSQTLSGAIESTDGQKQQRERAEQEELRRKQQGMHVDVNRRNK